MENPNVTPQQTDRAEEIVAKAKANKKTVYGVLIAAAVIVAAVIIYINVAAAGSRKADDAIAKADMEQNDSIATSLYAEAAKAGYKSGNRAKVEMGIRLFNDGKYEEAIKYLDDADIKGDIVAAGVYSLKGDCYVNLDKNADALKCYDKAIGTADGNTQLVPLFLVKKANVYRAEGDYAKEAAAYKELIDEYPEYVRASQTDIRKFYERAQAQAAK